MSYEHKVEIIMNLKDYNAGRRVLTGGTHAFESKIAELHEVYERAGKSDENERKAEVLEGIFIDYSTATAEHRFSLNDESAREFGYIVEELLNNYESEAE